ncbi:Photosystem II D1 precursor processing protein PSB27-H2- chloroplastic [Striga hermonthica]|uniref:Photosystem II D1 processing protein PSB27-H2- chloroplastic n=1 Tax=Striga hermonthica TaxID=68872 RepID=A0A9N7R0Q6_STRHE|nr:Photosystem II D1 precursor processing protein PSB27-H2- chloroplastic [Striga hermonthica]
MNRCAIQQNNFGACEEIWAAGRCMEKKETVVCPKPRRLGLAYATFDPSYARPLRWHMSHQQEDCDSRAGKRRRPRRLLLGCYAALVLTFLNSNRESLLLPALAEEDLNALEGKDETTSVVGAFKSLFEPNDKTKSGKVLPKSYLKSAREVVKTLRESLKESTVDMAKFRRTADAARESIREYLNGWTGQKTVVNEESYVMLGKAIRSLAGFYSKAGPSATLPEEVKTEILRDLATAEKSL